MGGITAGAVGMKKKDERNLEGRAGYVDARVCGGGISTMATYADGSCVHWDVMKTFPDVRLSN